jgi:hypothetical protein
VRILAAFAAVVLIACGRIEANGLDATAAAEGGAKMVIGANPYDTGTTASASGAIDIRVTDIGDRWSHVQNTDRVDVRASWTRGNDRFEVHIDRAMPRHPLGAYTTWMGVAQHHAQHGRTGIGASELPKVEPELSLWGYARVSVNGSVIAGDAPAHVMVTREGPLRGVMLDVASETRSLPGVPNGFLVVHWPEIRSLVMPERETFMRAAIGWSVLMALVLWFGWLASREPVTVRTLRDRAA